MKHLLAVVGIIALSATILSARQVAEPTPYHEHLEQFVGTWTLKATFMSGENGATEESEGEEKVRLAKSKLWTTSDFRGTFAGEKFLGGGMMIYDVKKKKYIQSWVDSDKSELILYEGTCDEAGKVFTLATKISDPNLGGEVTMKLTHTIKSATTRTLAFTLVTAKGDALEVGTIEYTKKDKKKKKDKDPK